MNPQCCNVSQFSLCCVDVVILFFTYSVPRRKDGLNMTSMAVLNAKHVPRLLQLLLLSQWQLLPPLQW